MKFEYKRYRINDGPDLTRPIIRVLINNPRDPNSTAIAYEALVDSGADFCVFPAEIAELLQIDLTAGEQRQAGGVVAGERRPVYFHPINVEVGPYGHHLRLPIWAGFMPDLADNGHGILGRHGFFSGVSFIKFRDHDNELEIGKKRP
jgi:hypothetical protein